MGEASRMRAAVALVPLLLLAPMALVPEGGALYPLLAKGHVADAGWVSFKLTLPSSWTLVWQANITIFGDRESDGATLMDNLNRTFLNTFGEWDGDRPTHLHTSSSASPLLTVDTQTSQLPTGLVSKTTMTCGPGCPFTGTKWGAAWVAGDIGGFDWSLEGTTGVVLVATLNGTGAFDVPGRDFDAALNANAGAFGLDTHVAHQAVETRHADHTMVGAFVSHALSPTFKMSAQRGSATQTCGFRQFPAYGVACYLPAFGMASGDFTFRMDGVEPIQAYVTLSGADVTLPP